MPDIIRLLPDNVANQIAAGEVVQRPGSIVKELLENAVDAGATMIELMIKDGGRTLVQVVDNGTGMSGTDARLAFERHATSKIRTTEDIFHIATKGFRGEALASIAAVAQVDLKTKKTEDAVGTFISINGGELITQETVQTSDGSSFAVKNLFYNVPARRKFLKSDNVEMRHILDEFQRVAMAHPQIEFSMYNNDSLVFKLRKAPEVHRILDIFGRKLQPYLVPINEDVDWVKLTGYVGKPEVAKRNRGQQFFFVNRRFFKSPYLSRAVLEAFQGLIQPQCIPSFFLFLEIDPEKIDVNIHPQKTEVKFENENVIFAMIRSSVKRALGIYNIAPSLDFTRNPETDDFLTAKTHPATIVPSNIQVDRNFNPFLNESQNPTHQQVVNLNEMYNVAPEPSKINLFNEEEEEDEGLMRLPNGFWICNRDGKTLLLDLGRIHDLVFFHKKPAKKYHFSNSRKLLFSHEIFLNETERLTYLSVREKLIAKGFDLNTVRGGLALQINAIPIDYEEKEAFELVQKIVSEYKEDEMHFDDFFKLKLNANRVKSNFDYTSKEEVTELLDEYKNLGFPEYNHKRKRCFLEIPLDELKNKLKA